MIVEANESTGTRHQEWETLRAESALVSLVGGRLFRTQRIMSKSNTEPILSSMRIVQGSSTGSLPPAIPTQRLEEMMLFDNDEQSHSSAKFRQQIDSKGSAVLLGNREKIRDCLAD